MQHKILDKVWSKKQTKSIQRVGCVETKSTKQYVYEK